MRVPNGVHRDRLSLILAVLSKHTGVKPFAVNVHTNVVGGMTMRWVSVLLRDIIPSKTVQMTLLLACQLAAGGHLLRAVSQHATCREPSTDLAIALAVASSYYNRGVPKMMAVVGEMGLAGELRCGLLHINAAVHLGMALVSSCKVGTLGVPK